MEIIDKLSNAAEGVADKIAGAASQAGEALGEKGHQLKEKEQQAMNNCRAYIREYPIASIGVALAAGFALSQLAHSCDHKKR